MAKEIERMRLQREMNGEKIRGNVGIINGDTFIINRVSKTHFLRIRQGYGISLNVLDELKDKGIKKITLIEHREDGTTQAYSCRLSDWDYLEPFQLPKNDVQKCLPLRLWEKIE